MTIKKHLLAYDQYPDVQGSRVSRRQVLSAVCGTSTIGLAGCGSSSQSGAPSQSGSRYGCTDIDDESTAFYDGDNPVPYRFKVPEVMEVKNVNRAADPGRVVFTHRWDDRRGSDVYTHSIDLSIGYSIFQTDQHEVRPMLLRENDPRGRVLGKRTAKGHSVGLLQRDATETAVRVALVIPDETIDGWNFFELEVEASAILQGRRQIEDDARSDDPDQTCQEALRALAVDVIDSVRVVSSTEEETTLSITPSSATVRRGESVELTVESSGVKWVDLLITDDDDQFDYRGSLEVGDNPTELRVAPPADSSSLAAVSVAEGGRLYTADATDEFVPGNYSVVLRAPGTDGLVRASTTLTIEPAG